MSFFRGNVNNPMPASRWGSEVRADELDDLTLYTRLFPDSEGSSRDRFKVCPHCKELHPKWRRRHVKRSCPGYGDLWAGDQRIKMFAALGAYGGDVTMVTVTAPGTDFLPWDEEHCAGLGDHVHSGNLGCRPQKDGMREWNETASARWRETHAAVSKVVKRNVGNRPVLLAKTWEMQRRGALHLHILLGYTEPWERAAASEYVDRLVAWAPRWNFGFVDRKKQVFEAKRAAAYVTSYLCSGKGKKLTLQESVRAYDMPHHVVYVSTRLTKQTGITMSTLRLRRYLYFAIGADQVRLAALLGLHLQDVYELVRCGYWGRAFLNWYVETQVAD